ncbi:UDP-N-acetylglucosamine 2-epimerase [Maridesulfovibrio bastinii]|uniref:UDP-N-acetylglucosamine 2-epimerase n=1 Tax=Maridesulfovibrio bastinii TaxID=47157 RepID=UPI0003FA3900|nr:UDP-N-acetylglucosamine 2-epimerase [Maridesulfovibrio bastinii]
MSAHRKVCVVITARPSYSRIKTALQAIKEHPDLELQIVLSASAILDRYGKVEDTIESDGFKIDARVQTIIEGDTLKASVKSTGLGLIELPSVFERLEPDMVVTIADRFETIATAISAAYMNIPLVHVQGGEVTGSIDEKVRHAITKLADIHLVSNSLAHERIIRLGEIPENIFITGCPSIDLAAKIHPTTELDFSPMEKYNGVGVPIAEDQDYLVVLQHPVTTEYGLAQEQVNCTLEAITELNIPTFWFWPNVDAGTDGTSKAIRIHREQFPTAPIHYFKNFAPMDFLKLISCAKVLVGNSSAGIRESSFLGVPVVNIGTRQNGRQRGKNVVDVNYDKQQISEAIKRQFNHGRYEQSFIYGDGKSGKRIAETLATVTLTNKKRLTY